MEREFIISRLAKSVFFFGIYIVLTGLFLLAFPGIILGIVCLDVSGSAVVRLLGMMLIFYGYYYIRAGISGKEMIGFFWWTVHTRMSAIIFLSALVLMNLAPPIIITFGVVDLSGAIWTLVELRISKRRFKKAGAD
ncbi:MAG: hypothetical protein U9O59_08675 [Actinomycetota bacterium]|nr:hypothetical protein [Actinomycetota bacterium]